MPVSPTIRAALKAFYKATGGASWAGNDQWLEGPGTECDLARQQEPPPELQLPRPRARGLRGVDGAARLPQRARHGVWWPGRDRSGERRPLEAQFLAHAPALD